MDRVSIEDVVGGVMGKSPYDARITHEVKSLVSIRKIGIALDQVVNRVQEESRHGSPSRLSSPMYAGDIAEAERHCRILEVAAKAGRDMIKALVDQEGPPSTPEREPETSNTLNHSEGVDLVADKSKLPDDTVPLNANSLADGNATLAPSNLKPGHSEDEKVLVLPPDGPIDPQAVPAETESKLIKVDKTPDKTKPK